MTSERLAACRANRLASDVMISADSLERGRESHARRAWGDAYAQLSAADREGSLEPEDLERLATAAYLFGKDTDDIWARAYHAFLDGGDRERAARCAFWLVLDLLTRGELARANGWLARTQHLLEDGRCDCAERGLVLVLAARQHIKLGDITAAHDNACQAVELAHRFEDPDLQVFSRLILGQITARRGNAAHAAALFDEIMVAVTVGDVSPIAVGIVYCAVIDTCYSQFDLGRAREWTAALSRWCSGQPDLVPFRGQCLVHRAELVRLNGAWSQALAEAEQACSWLTQTISQLETPADVHELSAFKYPVGPAFYQVAEIHRLRGNFAKAHAAYRQASEYGHPPEPGLALLRIAQGRADAAAAAIRRVLREPQSRPKRASVLAACVEIMIAVSDLPSARAAADELAAIAGECNAPYLRALSAQATGSALLAEGDAHAALVALRAAWMGWQEIEAPWEAARVRVLLGLACRALDDEDAAELEFESAQRIFQRLAAAPDVARVTMLQGSPASATAGGLTRRERQVVALLATGKTNRAIAQELAISERTVDRHVSNILTKLDLPSRSAVTAYAYAHGLV
jgi:DNA-binding CsgD family transcriptional regulator